MTKNLIAPLKALRVSRKYAAKTVSPPYDVVTREEAINQIKGNPYHFLRVSRAEIELSPTTDPYSSNVYQHARDNFNKLISESVLTQSAKPSLFVYQMVNQGNTQTGIACAASLAEYTNGRIRRHEFTRPAKENDRVQHIKTLSAQTGPVLLAHRPYMPLSNTINKIIENTKLPDISVNTVDLVRHNIWSIDEPDLVMSLANIVNQIDYLYIADGHHRCAAAARVFEAYPETSKYFFSVLMASDQLQILPYNRIVTDLNGHNEIDFLTLLAKKFHLQPIDTGVTAPQDGQIQMYLSQRWWRLDRRVPISKTSSTLSQLDVSLLMHDILEPLLGILDARTDPRLDFIGGNNSKTKIKYLVDMGKARVGFALCPTSIDDLFKIADAGKTMPPKSTWFEPKLADGLIAHLIR